MAVAQFNTIVKKKYAGSKLKLIYHVKYSKITQINTNHVSPIRFLWNAPLFPVRLSVGRVGLRLEGGDVLRGGEGATSLLVNWDATPALRRVGLTARLVQAGGDKVKAELRSFAAEVGRLEVNEAVAETSTGSLPFGGAIHVLAPEFDDFCGGSAEIAEDSLKVALALVFSTADKRRANCLVMSIPGNGLPIPVVAGAFGRACKEVDAKSPLSLIRFIDSDVSKLGTLRDALAAQAGVGVAAAAAETDSCAVCMCDLEDDDEIETLHKCSHKFHKPCIQEAFARMQAKCPICGTWYGVPKGTQPKGTMRVTKTQGALPGFPSNSGTIQIDYGLQGGVQGPEHPRPGVPFSGTARRAYLPDTPEGNVVLGLLKVAWDHSLVFTVGDSHTSGAQNTTVWNCIHHKTSPTGGAHGFGYPDDTYLERVEMELAAQGITRDFLPQKGKRGSSKK